MSIAVKTTEPIRIIKPPRVYPDWLAATFSDQNTPIPESVLAENRPKITPGMTMVATPGKILGGDPPPPAKYVPPPMVVQQLAKVPVKFRVFDSYGRPIFGFGIRANDENLVTDARGEATTETYQGHTVFFSTGRESGWGFPPGARRKVRMTGMIPMGDTFTADTPKTVILWPMAGEWDPGDGVTRQQAIRYTTS